MKTTLPVSDVREPTAKPGLGQSSWEGEPHLPSSVQKTQHTGSLESAFYLLLQDM